MKLHVLLTAAVLATAYSSYTPEQVMVDVSNEFGTCILKLVSSPSENVAFSPYGLVSVALVLYEGANGPTAAELHNSLRLPWDTQITRIGFRDLHRYLKSYFTNDGFLRGLVLSKPNVNLHRNYTTQLQFYGFDFKSEGPTIGPPTSQAPTLVPVSTIAPPTTKPSTTRAPDNITIPMTTKGREESTTMVPTITTEVVEGKDMGGETTMTKLSTPPVTTVEATTKKETDNEPAAGMPEGAGNGTTVDVSMVKTTVSMTVTTAVRPTTPPVTTEPPITTPPVAETTVAVITKAPTIATEAPQTKPPVTTTQAPTTVPPATTTEPPPPTTEPPPPTTQPPPLTTQPPPTTMQPPPPTTELPPPTTQPPPPTTQPPPPTTTTPEATTTEVPQTTPAAETTLAAETTSAPLAETTATPAPPAETTPATTEATTPQTTEGTTQVAVAVETDNAASESKQVTRLERALYSRGYVPQVREGIPNWVPHYQDPRWNQQTPHENWFFTPSGGERVPIITYTAYLPFAYITEIGALALQVPLDDPRYYMVIMLPEDRDGLEKLLYSLQWCSIRGIVNKLKTTAIYATIPSFAIVKHINLVPAMIKMGIVRIFDPARADLSAMSSESGLYVRTIEQVVTVSLRKYFANHRWFDATPADVEQHFIANHPFAYFVLDRETQVTLMTGTIVNPVAHNQ